MDKQEQISQAFGAGLITMAGIFFLVVSALYFFFDMPFGKAQNIDMYFSVGIGIALVIIGIITRSIIGGFAEKQK